MSDRIRTFGRSLVVLSLVCLTLAGSARSSSAAGEATLAVPFLPQTEALCGGAAAAMLYRYWGDPHADVQQFAPLVDKRAGGIRDTDLVAAIRDKGWVATQSSGSMVALRAQLARKQPVILLVEDRPRRYHFIVAVGSTDTTVIAHDPTWGPNRQWPIERLTRAWSAAGWWMLVVAPGPNGPPIAAPPAPAAASKRDIPSKCDRLLDRALDEIEARGLGIADTALNAVREQCPNDAGPLRELAGVKLAQSQPRQAATLSRAALRLDDTDRYAWDVLGSSLFVQDQVHGALEAWNQIGKPQLDSVEILGLTRTRYALVADILGLTPNTLLTARDVALADRRLEELPDRVGGRLGIAPSVDGFAKVTAALQETSRWPETGVEWGAAGLQTLVDRQIAATIAGGSGQGEVWSASWRWWENRPRVAAGFSAPRPGRWLGGVWRVEAAWEAQTYELGSAAPLFREDRRTGMLSIRNWLTPALRYELRAGLDVWNHDASAVMTGGSLETRLLGDRLSLQGTINRWSAVREGADFFSGSVGLTFRSSRSSRGLVATVSVRGDTASAAAPLALWSGAGDGRARPPLLRAHRLLDDGVIDGPVFGRTSGVTNVELQRWFPTGLAAIGIAAFTDLAAARDRLSSARGKAMQMDGGVGLRARLPGRPGTFRLDYGRGFVDGRQRISAAWIAGN